MPKQKAHFSKTDFSGSIPVPWELTHNSFARGFKCIYPKFRSDFLLQIPEEDRLHLSRCWVIIDNGHLVAYITLLSDRLEYRDEKGKKKKVSTAEGDLTAPPAVKIGLLSADMRAKRAGKALVDWSIGFIASNIAPQIGARFIKVDAYYDKNAKDKFGKPQPYDSSLFYLKLGFQYVDPNEKLPPRAAFRSMFLDLKPTIDRLAKEKL